MLRRLDLDLLLAGLLLQLLHRRAELLDLAVGDVERVEDLGLGDAVGARLDHQDRLVGAGDDQVQLQLLEGLLRRVDDEVAVELADPDRADVGGDGDRRDRQRRGGAVHREDVVGVDVVDRQRRGDELGLVVPALGEQRADRAVDHARGQRRLLARSALATEERAGDLARGVHPLLDVDGQGKEVHVAQVAHGRGAEDHRVAGLDDHRATRLLGEFARLEGNLAVADIHRDAAYVKHAHLVVLPPAARLAAICFQNSRSLSREESTCPRIRSGGRRQCRSRAGAGVAATPARIPDSKSRRTRLATSSERRSASKRSRSSPSLSARSQR